ncbi:MAG: glutathionylspermidine synthase family protein [Paenibacillaceae bacterium]|nr:glutathionylspermidine synthase family protein [Paenibacillaceae bacterium]
MAGDKQGASAGGAVDAGYAARRERIYGPLRAEGEFTWDFMYGEEYALASIYEAPAVLLRELAEATDRLGGVFRRAVDVLQGSAGDELLLALGVPEAALGAVRLRVPGLEMWPTVVGRFDFAATAEGVKMLEFNSDTPTGIVEAYLVNGRVCAACGRRDPNAGMAAHIAAAFGTAARAYAAAGGPIGSVRFSALGWHDEDAQTARYLMRQSGLAGASFVALEDLRVYEERLHELRDGVHTPIDLLYRLHAIEKLAEDKDEDGYPTGAHVLELIAQGRLAIINPPSAFLAQSKALQAVIWGMHETGDFFTAEEHEAIRRYMLPTYLENRFEGRVPYVTKPILGREGGGVTLYRADGQELARDAEEFYWEQPMVYQQLVELPLVRVEKLTGPYEGRLLWGSFLMGGRASAVVARVGGPITGNLSCYLPVAVRE